MSQIKADYDRAIKEIEKDIAMLTLERDKLVENRDLELIKEDAAFNAALLTVEERAKLIIEIDKKRFAKGANKK